MDVVDGLLQIEKFRLEKVEIVALGHRLPVVGRRARFPLHADASALRRLEVCGWASGCASVDDDLRCKIAIIHQLQHSPPTRGSEAQLIVAVLCVIYVKAVLRLPVHLVHQEMGRAVDLWQGWVHRWWASTGRDDKTDGNRMTVLRTLKSTGIGVPGSCLLKAQNVPVTSDRSTTFSITHLVWKSMSNS